MPLETANEDALAYIERLNRGEVAFTPRPPARQQMVVTPVIPPVAAPIDPPIASAPAVPPADPTLNFADAQLASELDGTPPPAAEDVPPADVESLEDHKKTPEESLSDMRKKNNELKRLAEERENQLKERDAELEKYKTGEAIPEKIAELEDRVTKLSRYEHLHALELSPEFDQNVLQPRNQLHAAAIEKAKEYEIDPQIIAQARSIGNRRDRNAYLKRNGFDDVGTSEVVDLIKQMEDLDKYEQELKVEPQQTLEELRQEAVKQQEVQKAVTSKAIANSGRASWSAALSDLRASGKYPELEIGDDPRQNQIARGLMSEAAKEYAAYIREFSNLGLKELPPHLAKAFAKRVLESQIVGVMAIEREHYYNESQEAVTTAKRHASLTRPVLGQSAPNPSIPAQSGPPAADHLQQAARRITDMVREQTARK